MTTELQEALDRASREAGQAFAARDAVEVIEPAARRVRRHRARLTGFATLGSVAVMTGMLWGAEALSPLPAPLEPASTPVSTVVAEDNSWATLELAAQTGPRRHGEVRKNSVAGMICNHESPTDDPRVSVARVNDPTVSHATAFEDCAPVWFKRGPSTGDMRSNISITQSPEARLSLEFSVVNTSDQPIEIDTESVFMWVETAPAEMGDGPLATYSRTLVGPSMWLDQSTVHALLDSGDDSTVVKPGERFSGLIVANELAGEGPLSDAASYRTPLKISVWARIHEESPSGDASYLVQLGETLTHYITEQVTLSDR